MIWKNKRVFVTGAGGFIGSHLTEALLNAGAHVTAMVRYNSSNRWGFLEERYHERDKRLTIFTGDIRDAGLMRRAIQGQDTVFHLAALIAIPYSYLAPESYIDTNVKGTLNILEACREARVRVLIQTSTSEVYGTARYVPIDENHPIHAQSPYAASKIAADQLALSYQASFGLPVVVVRPFNTYGPRQSARAVIPTILCGLLKKQKAPLRLGNLRPVRDFTYVQDTVQGFMKAAERPVPGQVLQLGSGQGVSIRELIGLCAQTLQVPVPALRPSSERIRRPNSEVWKLVGSHRKATRLLGWKPSVRLRDGLLETAAYIQSHSAEYKENLYNV